MERIELKCSSCGGKLNKIETQKDTYVCLSCGNKEIIKEEEKATTYYINQNITKHIYGNEAVEEDYYKIVKKAEDLIKIEEYKEAIKQLETAITIEVGNYLAWWLCAKAKLLFNLKNKTDNKLVIYFSEKSIKADFNKAIKFINETEKVKIEHEFQKLYKEYSRLFELDTYVEANLGKEQNMTKRKIGIIIAVLLFSLLSGLVAAFCIKSVLADADAQNMDIIGPASCIPVVIIIDLIVLVAGFKGINNDVKIIQFIKNHEECSFQEILNFCETNDILSIRDSEDIALKIVGLIKESYLVNYKIENGFVIKVNTEK